MCWCRSMIRCSARHASAFRRAAATSSFARTGGARTKQPMTRAARANLVCMMAGFIAKAPLLPSKMNRDILRARAVSPLKLGFELEQFGRRSGLRDRTAESSSHPRDVKHQQQHERPAEEVAGRFIGRQHEQHGDET